MSIGVEIKDVFDCSLELNNDQLVGGYFTLDMKSIAYTDLDDIIILDITLTIN